MNTNINEEFVKAIRKAIVEKDLAINRVEKNKVVSILADILYLGKEAIYRRLRGEVRFSLEEVEVISLALGISIDSIIGNENEKKSVFDLRFLGVADVYKNYLKNIEEYSDFFKRVSLGDSDSTLKCAFNNLPFFLYLNFENIAKFKLFKWVYQMSHSFSMPFKDMEIPKELLSAQKEFMTETRKVKKTSFILCQNIFISFIKEVNYFFNLNLLDEADIQKIKNELNELLDEMESISITGIFNSGTEVQLYLSSINIDSSYVHVKYDGYSYAYLNVYELSGIDSQNHTFCKASDEWINSLKRYSMLITRGNEMQRFRFFQDQRKIINSLGKWDL